LKKKILGKNEHMARGLLGTEPLVSVNDPP
jgi:hypothetical protein